MALPALTLDARLHALRADMAAIGELAAISPMAWPARIAARHRASAWAARVALDLTASGTVEEYHLDDAYAHWLEDACRAIGTTLDSRHRSANLAARAAAAALSALFDVASAGELIVGLAKVRPRGWAERVTAYRAYNRHIAELRCGVTSCPQSATAFGAGALERALFEEYESAGMAA